MLANNLGRLGLNSNELGYGLGKIADFVNYGNKQNAAKERLGMMLGNIDQAKQAALMMAKRLRGNTANPKKLGEAVSELPGMLQENGLALSGFIKNNGGKVGAGIRDFIRSKTDKVREEALRTTAELPENLWDAIAPYLSSYIVNRAGTNQVGERTRRLIDNKAGMFIEDEY